MKDEAYGSGPCDAFIPHHAVVTTILAAIYLPTQMIFICALYRLSTRRTLSDVILALISITDSVTFILYTIRVDGNRYLTPTAVQSRLWVTASLVLVYSTNTLNAFSQYLITLLAYYRILKMRCLFRVQSAQKLNDEIKFFQKTVVFSFVDQLGPMLCIWLPEMQSSVSSHAAMPTVSFEIDKMDGILFLSTPMFTSGVVRSTEPCFIVDNAKEIYNTWQGDKTFIWSDNRAQQHNETFWNEFLALLLTGSNIPATDIIPASLNIIDIEYEGNNMLCLVFLDESLITTYSVYVTYDILPVAAHWITGIVFKGVPCLAVMVATPLIVRQLVRARQHHDSVKRKQKKRSISIPKSKSQIEEQTTAWKKYRIEIRNELIAKNSSRSQSEPDLRQSEPDLKAVDRHLLQGRHQLTVTPLAGTPLASCISAISSAASSFRERQRSIYRRGHNIFTLKNQMLVLIMLIFLAAQLPVLVLSIGSCIGDVAPNKLFVIYSSCGPIFDIVTLLSGSAYFIVYALMSQQIRESIVSMFVNN